MCLFIYNNLDGFYSYITKKNNNIVFFIYFILIKYSLAYAVRACFKL